MWYATGLISVGATRCQDAHMIVAIWRLRGRRTVYGVVRVTSTMLASYVYTCGFMRMQRKVRVHVRTGDGVHTMYGCRMG